MREPSELKQAVALLAFAMTTGDVLSGCKSPAEVRRAPEVAPEGAPATGPADLAALRRAAAVVNEWQRRDAAQTERVLREYGVFACDETTVACIAAKHAADQASAAPVAPTPPVAPAVPPPAATVRIPTAHPAVRHHDDDRRAPVA